MKILVTGGAGYIGSFMTRRLLDEHIETIVVDSLERGHKDAIDQRAVFIHGDLCDKSFVDELFTKNIFDGVIHFAGYISMGESMQNPALYFDKNIIASVNVVDAMVRHDSDNLIFSSTAGVYGNPTKLPIPEGYPKNPENPYGESKLMVERILEWYGKIFHLSFASLRYFNAAGAALDGSLGEGHSPETHLIPAIITSLLDKKEFHLFGNDYNTADGTCIRDYIHVLDLVEAHILAMKQLHKDPGQYAYNVGTGRGHSNKEVVAAIEKVTGQKITVSYSPRRPGDANELVAEVTNITHDLGFSPKYSNILTIVESAWKWHSSKRDE